jgi:DNA-binding MarR family transcriptional regulator
MRAHAGNGRVTSRSANRSGARGSLRHARDARAGMHPARLLRASERRDVVQRGAPLGICVDLLSCASLIQGEMRVRLRREFASTLPRFALLAELQAAADGAAGGLTMSEISRRMMVTNGNVTGLAERLVQEGLVMREGSPTDGRMHVLHITRAGRRALAAMTPAHRAWVARMFAGLTRHERTRLTALLEKLKRSVRAASHGSDVR